ncbi:MAG: RagB/SusD family nutrient uptake outer membrane protein [Bacteroidota bacterium]|nr:RagB/SusD family nutrient uptake outer membrane protein [Bacteroidota bacterium]
MKYSIYLILIFCIALVSCKKTIDLVPESNLSSATFYKTEADMRIAMVGCYNGMQRAMSNEWQLTELRSDNSKQAETGSQNSFNLDNNTMDMFFPATGNNAIYTYWLNTYNNIRNTNIVLQKLGVTYDPATGANIFGTSDIPMTDSVRKQLAGEAMFIRAHHYFNLVRLYGGVFLIHTPISAAEAKTINRSSVNDIYKLILADLTTASTNLSGKTFSQISAGDIGKASRWAAKALLGKVYLTLGRKPEAITELTGVLTASSGYSLETTYPNVFSITNEMNREIIFTIRYKAGGLGLGSSFGNDFAAGSSGSTIINGSGQGWNTATFDLDTAYMTTISATPVYDPRRVFNIGNFGTGNSLRLYPRKYLNPVVITNDGESDWPIIRYADVILMLAEAQGNNATSIGYISAVRTRAGVTALSTSLTTVQFEQALSNERRLEFAFENQRFFDLVRFNTTLTTITAEQTIKNHFAREYASHYIRYPVPRLTLAELQAKVDANHLLLPIPQYELDTNTQLVIAQNPGY